MRTRHLSRSRQHQSLLPQRHRVEGTEDVLGSGSQFRERVDHGTHGRGEKGVASGNRQVQETLRRTNGESQKYLRQDDEHRRSRCGLIS